MLFIDDMRYYATQNKTNMSHSMNICLKTHAKDTSPTTVVLALENRLPARVLNTCNISCTFQVQQASDHFLLKIETSGDVTVICQRCLDGFSYAYHNQTTLAVCPNNVIAERLMASFECIDGQETIDLNEVVVDDLHLHLPEKHADISHCNPEINQLIQD